MHFTTHKFSTKKCLNFNGTLTTGKAVGNNVNEAKLNIHQKWEETFEIEVTQKKAACIHGFLVFNHLSFAEQFHWMKEIDRDYAGQIRF